MEDAEINKIFKELNSANQETIKYFVDDLNRYYVGRATPTLLYGVKVDYYGQYVPLDHAATISVKGHDALIIVPFDKSMNKDIERAIHKANLGLNPQADSEMVKVYLPKQTKENDLNIFKIIKDRAETARVAIRYNRRHARLNLEKFDHLSEDDKHKFEKEVQLETDSYIEKIDTILENKRKMMKV